MSYDLPPLSGSGPQFMNLPDQPTILVVPIVVRVGLENISNPFPAPESIQPDLVKPMPNAEGQPQTDGNQQKTDKSYQDLAEKIARELLPKCSFLIMRPVHQSQISKQTPKEKNSAEELGDKSQESKSIAIAKGEAKTTQGAGIPEEVEPIEKTVAGLRQQIQQQGNGGRSNGAATNTNDDSAAIESEIQTLGSLTETEIAVHKDATKSSLPSNEESKIAQGGKGSDTSPITQIKVFSPASSHPASPPVTRDHEHDKQNHASKGGAQQHEAAFPSRITEGDPRSQLPAQSGKENMHEAKNKASLERLDRQREAVVDATKKPEASDHPAAVLGPRDLKEVVDRLPFFPGQLFTQKGVVQQGQAKGGVVAEEKDGYNLGDLVLMLICACVCGATSMPEIVHYLKERAHFFFAWLGIKYRLPSPRLMIQLLSALQPRRMNELMLFALNKPSDISELNNVRLWETERGLIAGEIFHPEAKKEGDPLLALLECFNSSGAVVAIFPSRPSKFYARTVHQQKGIYLVAVKRNKDSTFSRGDEFFKTLPEESRVSYRDVFESKNKAEIHEVVMSEDTSWFEGHDDWSGLKSSLQVTTNINVGENSWNDHKIFLTNLSIDSLETTRTIHWLNPLDRLLEWYVDFDFQFGKRNHYQDNLAALQQFGWTLLTQDLSSNEKPEEKRKKASISHEYLRTILF